MPHRTFTGPKFTPWRVDHVGPFKNFALDTYASFKSVWRILSSVQTAFVAFLSIGSPCFFYWYREGDDNALSFNMNWSLISIAVLFPLTMSVTSAFQRREQAIAVLATFKANLTSIYYAHKDWDWDKGGAKSRSGNTLRHDHISDVSYQIAALVKTTIRLLRAPIVSKARHRFTALGRAESARVSSQMTVLDTRVHVNFGILSGLVEELKNAGLPPNEATRIRQYFTAVVVSYEHLRSLKSYRTPQGIRTFARVFIMLTPIVMGPYYAYLAGTDATTEGVGLPFACFFSLLASMSMQGLFAIRVKMEDPFSDGAKKAVTDTIDLKEQFASLFYILRQTMINPATIAAAPADIVEGVAVCRHDTPTSLAASVGPPAMSEV